MKIFLLNVIVLCCVFNVFAEEGVFKYDSGNKRDPFVPLVSKDGTHVPDAYGIKGIRDIRLEGIVWEQGGSSIAIINGEIVKPGDEIGLVKVLRIDDNAVVLGIDGEEVRVGLEQE